MDQVKIVEDSLLKNLSDMACSNRPYSVKNLRLSSTNFTWPILEYFVSNNCQWVEDTSWKYV